MNPLNYIEENINIQVWHDLNERVRKLKCIQFSKIECKTDWILITQDMVSRGFVSIIKKDEKVVNSIDPINLIFRLESTFEKETFDPEQYNVIPAVYINPTFSKLEIDEVIEKMRIIFDKNKNIEKNKIKSMTDMPNQISFPFFYYKWNATKMDLEKIGFSKKLNGFLFLYKDDDGIELNLFRPVIKQKDMSKMLWINLEEEQCS